MSHTGFVFRLLALVTPALALCHGSAAAGTAVPIWENTFRRDLPGAGFQSVISARELADGSTMVVANDNAGLSAIRYDHDGNQLSAVAFYPPYGAKFAAIDPFGAVFVVSQSDIPLNPLTDIGDIWTMKYDGLTGRALWPAPQVYDDPSNHKDSPSSVFLDSAGNVLIVGVWTDGFSTLGRVVLKYDGASGLPSWLPAETFVGFSTQVLAAADPAGNIVLAEVASSGGFRVMLLDGSTGTPYWQVNPLSGSGFFYYVAIRTDKGGNVLLTGHRQTGVLEAIETYKLSGATGSTLWGPVGLPGSADTQPTLLSVGSDGNPVIAGIAGAQPFLAKLTGSSGAEIWRTVPEASPQILSITGNGDVVAAVQVPQEIGSQLSTWRFSGATGAKVWGPLSVPDNDYAPFASFVASNGRVFTAVTTFPSANRSVVSVLERDALSGSPIWGPVTFPGIGAARSLLGEVAVGPDGNVVVAGDAASPDGFTRSAALIKYDTATGAILWGPILVDTPFPGAGPPAPIAFDAAGGVFIAFRSGVVQKRSGSNGSLIWEYATAISRHSLFVDPAGNPILVGGMLGGSFNDFAAIKLSSATGLPAWGPVHFDGGGDADDRVFASGMDASGNVFLTGQTSHGLTNFQPQWMTLKVSGSTGALAWGPILFLGPNWPTAQAIGLAVTQDGDAVVTGNANSDMATIKYSGATGAVLWGPKYVDGGANYNDGGNAVTVNASGDAFVTGFVYTSDNTYDYGTVKYRGSDGAVLWGPVLFDGEAHDVEAALLVAVDSSGNPVVSGESRNAEHNWDIVTLEYDGASGALRWGPLVTRSAGEERLSGLALLGDRVFVGARSGSAFLTGAYTESLGIETMTGAVPSASCGLPYDFALVARNGVPSYSWTVFSGDLPPGISLSSSGILSGTSVADGVFAFEVKVEDSVGATAIRRLELVVEDGAPYLPVLASSDPDCQITLSVAGSYSSYQWLPGGETSPEIVVFPLETTRYGVTVTEASGCRRRGSVTIPGEVLTNPACLAPSIASITPRSGPAAGGTPVTIAGSNFQQGAEVLIGPVPASGVSVVGPSEITASSPALLPGTVGNVIVVNPDTSNGVRIGAWLADFQDLPPSDPFHDAIVKVALAGITLGCGGGNYCGDASVTRAQIAIFVLRGEHGSAYQPPPATGTVFADVPFDAFAKWIERFAAEGITTGCGDRIYCPALTVTRGEMAVFLLRGKHGGSYSPPPATGMRFLDVPANAPFAKWIEQLSVEGITQGCGNGNYCPDLPVTRGQLAAFLARTFGL